MEEKLRKTGIDIIGEIPWGTHFCQFYQTKKDLLEILVPYFKAGLENNEYCLWITSEPLNEKEVQKAMKKTLLNFDRYLKRRQIEIIPHTKWYLKDGDFNLQRVLDAWTDKFNQALARNYDGIRITGNTTWLKEKDWKNFADYEERANNSIGEYPVIAICSYCLDKYGAVEVINVVSNHQFALIKRENKWEILESSEHRLMKKALQESEERFRAVAESAIDAIISIDSHGNIVFCNKAAENIFGYLTDEIMGKPLVLIMPERFRKAHQKGLKRVALTEKYKIVGKTVEMLGLRKDGSEFPAELSLATWKTKKDVFFTSIIRDITERRQAEEELKKAKASVEQKVKEATHRLKQQHEAQQNFFIDLAHELKTPLTILKGNFDLALKRNPRNFSRFLVSQKEEIERIEKIINNLCTLAKADTKQLTFQFNEARLDEIIRKICLRLQTVVKQEKKKLLFKKRMPLTIMGDQGWLEQLISNLLDNAIKFTKPRSGQVEIFLAERRDKAKIRIKDNGVGISKKDLPHIFERFYRGNNATYHSAVRGSGLGLVICDWIVKEHHGEITVKSKKGKGTEVLIFLPKNLNKHPTRTVS